MTEMKKNVGIFMGGYSSEWQISMQSGQTVYSNLDPAEFNRYKVSIRQDAWTVTDETGTWPLKKDTLTFFKGEEEIHFDVIFNAIHGHPGEDGYMQALFELNNIAHSSCGFFESALTFNKSKTNALLKAEGITVPKARFYTATKNIDTKELCAFFGLPLFIKPNRSGSSFGVTRVNTEADVLPALEAALKEDDQIVIEEAILGTEVGCGVVRRNGKTEAIAVTEIVPKREFFDYKAKYEGASEEITPARIDQKVYDAICAQSEKIYDYLGLWGVVRVDYIIRENVPYLIEINSIPGLSGASIVPQQLAYKQWPLPQFFAGLLNDSIKKHDQK